MFDNKISDTNSINNANTAILVSLNPRINNESEDLEELRQLALSDQLTIIAEVQ